jgi:two-component system, NarL family, sensor kinase
LRKAREMVVIASDEERRRLRRELHDEFSPALGGCILTLERLKETAGDGKADVGTTVDRVCNNLHTLRTEIRQLSYQLIPEFLDLGLSTAIRQMAEDFRSRHPAMRVNLDLAMTLPELPAAVERASYHVVQGALRNIEQHAHAHCCDIAVTLVSPDEGAKEQPDRTHSHLCITVSDDGVGLPVWHRPGVGLTTMRERVETLGGRLKIRAGEPAGVHIEMCIPLYVMAHRT